MSNENHQNKLNTGKILFANSFVLCENLENQINQQEKIFGNQSKLNQLLNQIEIVKNRISNLEESVDERERMIKNELTNFQAEIGLELIRIHQEEQKAINQINLMRSKIKDIKEIISLNTFEINRIKDSITNLKLDEIKVLHVIKSAKEHFKDKKTAYNYESKINNLKEKLSKREEKISTICISIDLINKREGNFEDLKNTNSIKYKKIQEKIQIMKMKIKKEKKKKISIQNPNEEKPLISNLNFEMLRKKQLKYQSRVSALTKKIHLIDINLYNVYDKISNYQKPFQILKGNQILDQDDNQLFMKLKLDSHQNTKRIKLNFHQIYISMKKELQEIRNERIVKLKKLMEKKKNLVDLNKNIAYLIKSRDSIDNECNELDILFKRKTNLLEYYNEHQNENDAIVLNNKDIKQIKKHGEKLAMIHVNHENQISNRIYKIHKEIVDIIYQISYQRAINKALKKKIFQIAKQKHLIR